MRTYSDRRSNTFLRLWTIPVTVVVLFVLHYTHILKPAENLFALMLQPVQHFMYSIVQRTVGSTQSGIPESELQKKIDRLSIDNAHLKSLVDESKLLSTQVEFLESHSFPAITARVISRSTDQLTETVIVNVGKSDGVRPELPVITDNGICIGVISSVRDHSSQITLLTSFDARVSAIVQNAVKSPGIVRGEHNLSLRMEFIPQLDTVLKDDTVITSGIDPSIPQGLILGVVQEVNSEPGSLFQEASLKPLFDPAALSVVSIIVPML